MIEVQILSELKPLIPRFLENRIGETELAETLLSSGDFVALDRYGHSLKGTCMGYGFHAVIPIADEIQAAAKAQSVERTRSAVAKVRQFFSETNIRYVDSI